VPDPFATATHASTPVSLLEGIPGRPGFLFHDAHNQPVHRAAPGILGLVEARHVIGRWKPRVLGWLDETEHFFNHLLAEFDSITAFEPSRRELEAIRRLDAPWPAKNAFLFRYLDTLARGLERDALGATKARPLPSDDRGDHDLNGTWTVRSRGGDEWAEREVTLPVNWELLPGIDDYAGTMRFTRAFAAPKRRGDATVTLRLCGVDYFADVWLNGYYLGGHEGYFGEFSFDVGAYLRPDANLLRVAVTSPNDPSGQGTHVTSGWHDFSPASAFPNRKTLIKGTLGHHDAKRGGAWSSITSQDGNTGGIWDAVILSVRNPIHLDPSSIRIAALSTTPDKKTGGARAATRTTLTVANRTGKGMPARVRLLFEPANFEGEAHELVKATRLDPGRNHLTVAGTLSPVQLWHPADHGFPHLYRVRVLLEAEGGVQDETVVETGFRTLAVNQIGESTGEDGAFVVNGRPVFVRGTNLLPTYWLSEYTPERVERDFEMLRAAGFNAVLVHNLVAPRHFYEGANRHGFLVVQMFPLQWSYDQSDEICDRMTAQIRSMADLLFNEPSVVSYEVHNEPDMRTFEDIDNRFFDFDLHAVVRDADPARWATTFSSGNHAYPGQFYPLRDDNGFATLPARFLEEDFTGRRISRHRNMPTEFGIQAMPNVDLFRELVSEPRVRSVLERIRNDPKWLAHGSDTAANASKALDQAIEVLGRGSWSRVLKTFDWSLLWALPELTERIRRLEHLPATDANEVELASLRLAILLLDVLHYGGFKGENFWFGHWKPASTLEGFVASGQARQYRLHKDAIEHYLNAGVVGPIVGYFSFMFRDADWEAPTWGVVDAAWVPKKAYRAYVESNHPVRVSLPQALRSPLKFPGGPWAATAPEDRERFAGAPWAGAEILVANDTAVPMPGATVELWVEDAAGARLDVLDARLTVDLPTVPGSVLDAPKATLPANLPGGTYFLKARVSSAGGDVGSTNAYEIVVPDTSFVWLDSLPTDDVAGLLDGAPAVEGFHFWHGGAVVHRSYAGVRGLLAGWSHVIALGTDQYETIQGEHLFRHVQSEFAGMAGAGRLLDDVWTIRSEVISPQVKSRALLRYLELLAERAQAVVETPRRRPSKRAAKSPGPARPEPPAESPFPAVGRDVKPSRAGVRHSRPMTAIPSGGNT
jgi:hypothetical protein